jgi:hypothetical protein
VRVSCIKQSDDIMFKFPWSTIEILYTFSKCLPEHRSAEGLIARARIRPVVHGEQTTHDCEFARPRQLGTSFRRLGFLEQSAAAEASFFLD